jgi:hypothetical protein
MSGGFLTSPKGVIKDLAVLISNTMQRGEMLNEAKGIQTKANDGPGNEFIERDGSCFT